MRVRNFVAFAPVAVAGGQLSVGAQPKGTRTTISGEVVDLWCYLEGGDRGPAKKECAIAGAKAGNPIGVVDAKGNVYVAAGNLDDRPSVARRDKFLTSLSGRSSNRSTRL
jgi:hypothetical protein